MAAGVLPPPGSKYGPCAVACQHRDCKLTREQAASLCKICEGPIGYDTEYFNVLPSGFVHADCLEQGLEPAVPPG